MNIERLQLLRDVLIEVRDQRKPFDMSQWVDAEEIQDINCKTAACALGWLVRDPRGKTLGLSFDISPDADGLSVMYHGKRETGANFFDITARQAYDLFMPSSYRIEPIPIDAVIFRVDELLATS